MVYVNFKKISLILMILTIMVFCLQEISLAANPIIYSNGTLRLTTPDGAITTIDQGDTLPSVPSGSIIEVLDGSIDIMAVEGFIQLVVGDSVATVKAGNRVVATVDLGENESSFKVLIGEIGISTGNTTTTLGEGQSAQIALSSRTGIVEVKSLSGNISTMTNGIMVSIPKNAIASIDVDPRTREVSVESVRGRIQVVAMDGKIIRLARADSVEMPGSEVGRIQTFGDDIEDIDFVLEEEPVEPEVPEASPHRS